MLFAASDLGTVHAIETGLLAALPPALLLGDDILGDKANARTRSRVLRAGYAGLLCVAIAIGLAVLGRNAWRSFVTPPPADFQTFWIWGRTLVSGHNPYASEALHAAAVGTPVDPEIVPWFDVGCVYPPPTLLLFAPLGWLSFKAAAGAWIGVQLLSVVCSMLLLWRLFLVDRGLRGLALAAALTGLIPAGWITIGDTQTNFLTLAFALAAWLMRDRAAGGAYMACAAIVKPIYSILTLYPLIRRRWRAFVASVVTVLVATLASAAAFGTETALTYVRDNPVNRLPQRFFIAEWGVQSLPATIMRVAPHQFLTASPALNPLYITLATAILVITVWLMLRLPRTREGEDIAFGILIPTGMLLYPGTLAMYSVMLLPTIVLLWTRRHAWPAGAIWTAALATIVYVITYAFRAHYSIVATILVWGALVAHGARLTPAWGTTPRVGK